MMGKSIYDALSAALPVKLNRRWFIYGNIYPDISHYCFTIPHYPDRSIGFVKRLMHSLSLANIAPGDRLDAMFSMQLGVLCHYLCDYYCHVHSSAFTGPLSKHFAYEIKQNAILMRHPFMIGKKRNRQNPVSYFCPRDIDDVFRQLDLSQQEYLAKSHHPGEDIVLAVRNATFFSMAILNLCMANVTESVINLAPLPI